MSRTGLSSWTFILFPKSISQQVTVLFGTRYLPTFPFPRDARTFAFSLDWISAPPTSPRRPLLHYLLRDARGGIDSSEGGLCEVYLRIKIIPDAYPLSLQCNSSAVSRWSVPEHHTLSLVYYLFTLLTPSRYQRETTPYIISGRTALTQKAL